MCTKVNFNRLSRTTPFSESTESWLHSLIYRRLFWKGKGLIPSQLFLPFKNAANFWKFARLINLDSIKLNDLNKREEFINSLKIVSQYTATSEETRNEKQYFECNGPERLVLACRISTMESLNHKFVADQRLWKWIAIYLKQRDTYMFPTLEGVFK